MITNLTTDWVFRDVSEITPQWLTERGLRAVVTDLDNTLAGYKEQTPHEKADGWLKSLHEAGIPVAVLSNNNQKRVAAFCEPLGIYFIAKSGKPKPHNILVAMEKLGSTPSDTVMVGDQVFTDVRAGKRAGIKTVLVEPLTLNIWYRLRRLVEKPFIHAAKCKKKAGSARSKG